MKRIYFLWVLSFSMSPVSCTQENTGTAKVRTSLENEQQGLGSATFAGGCFWCVEAVFERVNGVVEVVSGYTGGNESNPTYENVSMGNTSHAEAVHIVFNPEVISYKTLLKIFFATHDPTTLNRQGPDIGKQYRSAVYYHDESQRETVENMVDELTRERVYKNPIVTEIAPFKIFYEAEDYHQDYYENNPRDPYILSIAKPKIEKFERDFKEVLRR